MKSLKRVEGINVVPLIDIMLVLLTIVLTISSFIALGKIELTLPSGSVQEKMEPKSYDIAISSQRKFYVNGEKIEKASLEQKFLEITKNDTVTIRADKLTPYEEFVFIIDVLKQKGIEKIGMVVQDE